MFSFGMKRMFGNASDSVKNSVRDKSNDQSGGVNWQEFNYPPCITVVHFDPDNDNIPSTAKITVRRMKWMWQYGVGILMFNICSSIGFVASGIEPGIVILYTILQFITGAVAGFVSLYQGYRGVAGDLVRNSRIYLGLQAALTVLMIVFASIKSGNVHGFSGATSEQHTEQPAYLVFCIFEGTMWIVCTFFSIHCMYRVYRYPGHERAARYDAASTESDQSTEKSKPTPRKGRTPRTDRDRETSSTASEREDSHPPPRSSKKKKKTKPTPEEEV